METLLFFLAPIIFSILLSMLSDNRRLYFKNFIKLFILGHICSWIPGLFISAIMGFDAYTINAAIISLMITNNKILEKVKI